jgi:uncharacterized protein YcaQ
MTPELQLTPPGARALMLAAQGLLQRPRRRATKADVLESIRRMGALQIDTISVVARSPYFVLWSRLGAYEPRWLEEHLAEGRLFEYWARAACFLPIEDFPLYRPRMLNGRERTLAWHDRIRAWLSEHPEVAERVMARLRAEGETRSSDFEREGKGGTWWDWKPEKQALESMFYLGEVMIVRRESFQRVYALRERVLPDWDDARTPTPEEARRALIVKTVRALGIARPSWVPDYFGLRVQGMPSDLEDLAQAGELLPARVTGWDGPFYVHPDHLETAQRAADGALRPTLTTLLSPFDPITWHRPRALEGFGFHYRIETYTPAEKRQYGYFSLPILRRGALIGRLDAKAYRKEGRFEVRSLHLEPGVRVSDALAADLRAALSDCARWHATPEVTVLMSAPPELAAALTSTP